MEFRLLGPVGVAHDGTPLGVGGTKVRTLLAALLLEAGRVVPADRLVDILWDDDPPATARALIQTYVSALRRALHDDPPAIVVTRAPGYLIRLGSARLDRDEFERLVARGRAAAGAGRHQEAADAFRAADAVWHGPALGGVRSRVLAAEAARLDEQRLAVTEARVEADLALGRTAELVGELTVLVGAHPTRGPVRRQLMLALHRSGRTAEALAVYRRGRETLVEELGIEPEAELTALHDALLRGDTVTPAAVGGLIPAQLPPDSADFTGRTDLVAQLGDRLAAPGPAVVALLGPGGVGKSALAVHVAHRVAGGYPDGQLHADLRGNTDTPASPAEILGRFLRALRPEAAVPDGTGERVDAYRTLLASRRMLIVLDDAADERQVRPLLPGSGTSSVLVTSRARLAGLDGARLQELDLLPTAEATALLARVAGAERIDADPAAAAAIVAACGNLPLAVRVAGARLATRRQWTAGLLADRLRDERRRLDELSAGDQRLRVSIGLSFAGLDPRVRTAIHLLGQLGLSDFRSWVLAYALDVPVVEAERILEGLVDAHLVDYTYVDATGHVRYRLHDLVRIYAREQAEQLEPRDILVAATARVAGAWSAVLDRLSEHITDHATSGMILPVAPFLLASADVDSGALSEALADPRGWLDAEQTSLVPAVERAAEFGLDRHALALAAVLCSSTYVLHSVPDLWERAHRAALGAVRRAGDVHGEAVLLACLGQVRYEQDDYPAARRHLTEAAERFRDLGDERGQASALAAIGLAAREQGYLPEAEHFLAQAAGLAARLGDDRAVGHVARLIGSVHLERGDVAAADTALASSLAAYRRAGAVRGQALALRSIALAHRAQGRYAEAEDVLRQALSICAELGDAKLTAFCRRALAKVWVRSGRLAEARPPLEQALAEHRAERDKWAEAMALRTLGELDLAVGNLDEAGAALTAAARIFQAQGATLFWARTVRDLAELAAARGDHAGAGRARTEAIDTFRAYGSREYTELTGLPLPAL
ncbi:AfsR/SARP family transcriptional regulator [Symbioplanes lichenis]|uniref:AfsR/SARP family transcriptional regulator n=1 Tax=Symbioplanes lichenis TaxID=1629072 RepID=UPI002739D05D|nr:BTAD domain-containing putative transcriptional regulator [Actinoplanes lichenis]